VIEDVGDSDLYDPWGGRPVGLARVAGGRLVEPANFGELFLLTGRSSMITEDVSVLADGSAGGPAIIRTVGTLHPMPFFSSVTMGVFQDLTGVRAAIDYELAPGSRSHRHPLPLPERRRSPARDRRHPARADVHRAHADLRARRRLRAIRSAARRTSALVDDGATSWAYVPAGQIGSALAVSGFVGGVAPGLPPAACARSIASTRP
jgi:hypothetical protein